MGDLIPLAIGASDSDGEIAEVLVYINNQLITSLKHPPFTYSIATVDVGSGSLVIKAEAKDNGGLKASDDITVRVDELELPVVYTMVVNSLSSVSVECFGQVVADGGSEVTERGICWNMVGDPTLLDMHKPGGEGIGHFKADISGLECNTTYYFRAYAINEVGISYADSKTFTTEDLPAVSTSPVTGQTSTSTQSGGTITDVCGSAILSKGVCWSSSPNPTIDDMHTDEGSGSESYTSLLTDLALGIRYYVRAYVTVSDGNIYGEEKSLRTWDNSPITDIDGNEYSTVLIGDQIWMAENLRVVRFADGTPIPKIEDDTAWAAIVYPGKAYCWYENDSASYAATYGALYNYEAAKRGYETYNPKMVQGVCPDGWHMPDNREWASLINYLGGDEIAGGKLKEAGTTHWQNPNTGATNESGFTALPGGYRSNYGRFFNLGLGAYWAHNTDRYTYNDWFYWLYYTNNDIRKVRPSFTDAYSVRCLKD